MKASCSSWPARFNNLADAAVDLLFPPSCVACHRLGAWFCPGCLATVETIQAPVCSRCGLPVAGAAHAECRSPLFLDGLLSCAFHGGTLREAIHQFKYEGMRVLAVPLGRFMAAAWCRLALPSIDLDAIVPVPLHASRMRKRGYNQSALLAREIAAQLQVPVVDSVLVRTRATLPQVELGPLERRANVRDAFQCQSSALSGRRVMLVDDVLTTGATLESAGRALKEVATCSIVGFTLARAI